MVGALAPGEDLSTIQAALLNAPALVLCGKAQLLSHADLDRRATASERENERRSRMAKLDALKRYVLLCETDAGARIIKIAAVTNLGNSLLGLLGSSVPRKEHRFHTHAETLGLAATRSLGYLEWRAGPCLRRACQVQSLLELDAVSLDTFLAVEIERHGDCALEPLARALAHSHAKGFFHADLKGFHAFVDNVKVEKDQPATYDLRWIDLARVGFRLSERQRVINLYQTLRFVVPNRPEAQRRFVDAYCQSSGWLTDQPDRALAKVQKFLAHKYRTHPLP